MHGLLFQGIRKIEFRDDLPDPVIEQPTDAVIAVSRAGLCGSDLHTYEGRETARPGVVPGHEAVGTVILVGDEVSRFSVGDRVLVPFTTSCGICRWCRRGLAARCERGQLFGWGDPDDLSAPAVHGGQASMLRVPLADGTLVGIPAGVSDPQAILLTDNLPTGWYAAERSDPVTDEPAMVVGLGSVGLSAIVSLRALGADPIFAVDPMDDRLEQSARLGAVPMSPGDPAIPDDLPSVIEAAGTSAAQGFAFRSVRPGGTLSVIAVQTEPAFPFSPIEAYDRNITVRFGRAPVRSVLDQILPMLDEGRLTVPDDVVVTHPEERLQDGPDLYQAFAEREPGLIKALFAP
ncbi:MAG: alcohol dehydrogenase catalytic domain-containing protein [Acidimicrobiia bacterium]|nr:alcohol dehydrogenase catalytic domain-containing protein [Acidimicrobiia bacterium]